MADLVRNLALVLSRPVLDKTGFTGDFDLNLSFTPDDATMGLPGYGGPGDPGGTRLPTDPNLPNIFAALEGQLGLKLVPAKAQWRFSLSITWRDLRQTKWPVG
jgi:uncharacterized protein (TIGR03435 family)